MEGEDQFIMEESDEEEGIAAENEYEEEFWLWSADSIDLID